MARKIFFDQIQTGGRPLFKLNEEGITQIKYLASFGCIDEEIAASLGTTVKLLYNETNRDAFESAKRAGIGQYKQSLRLFQFEAAKRGDAKMLIFLSKNILAQSDNPVLPKEQLQMEEDPISKALQKSFSEIGGDDDELYSDELEISQGNGDADTESD